MLDILNFYKKIHFIQNIDHSIIIQRKKVRGQSFESKERKKLNLNYIAEFL